MSVPIEKIREAFFRLHDNASGRTAVSYMSIPANPERDADLILSAAIDELQALRADRLALAERIRAACVVELVRKAVPKDTARARIHALDLAPLLETPS